MVAVLRVSKLSQSKNKQTSKKQTNNVLRFSKLSNEQKLKDTKSSKDIKRRGWQSYRYNGDDDAYDALEYDGEDDDDHGEDDDDLRQYNTPYT